MRFLKRCLAAHRHPDIGYRRNRQLPSLGMFLGERDPGACGLGMVRHCVNGSAIGPATFVGRTGGYPHAKSGGPDHKA